MKNAVQLPIVIIFFLIIAFIYISHLYYFAEICDGWCIADWLINFDAGFVRRGLSGYLIITLSDLIGIKANFTTFWIQSFIYISFLIILYVLLYRKQLTFWYWILLLSPVTLLFPIYDKPATGRKEIILFFLFGLYMLVLNRKIISSSLITILFFLAIIIMTLCHEGLFFYTPYFVVASYLKLKSEGQPFDFKSLYLMASSLLVLVVIYLFGQTINGTIICDGLMKRGIHGEICDGVLVWKTSFSEALKFILEKKYLPGYFFTFILGIAPFILFVKYSAVHFISFKKIIASVLLLILFSVALFVRTIDWGRWLNIHFVLLMLLFTFFLKNKPITLEESDKPMEDDRKKSPLLKKVIIVLVTVVYLTTWSTSVYKIPLVGFKFYKTISEICNK